MISFNEWKKLQKLQKHHVPLMAAAAENCTDAGAGAATVGKNNATDHPVSESETTRGAADRGNEAGKSSTGEEESNVMIKVLRYYCRLHNLAKPRLKVQFNDGMFTAICEVKPHAHVAHSLISMECKNEAAFNVLSLLAVGEKVENIVAAWRTSMGKNTDKSAVDKQKSEALTRAQKRTVKRKAKRKAQRAAIRVAKRAEKMAAKKAVEKAAKIEATKAKKVAKITANRAKKAAKKAKKAKQAKQAKQKVEQIFYIHIPMKIFPTLHDDLDDEPLNQDQFQPHQEPYYQPHHQPHYQPHYQPQYQPLHQPQHQLQLHPQLQLQLQLQRQWQLQWQLQLQLQWQLQWQHQLYHQLHHQLLYQPQYHPYHHPQHYPHHQLQYHPYNQPHNHPLHQPQYQLHHQLHHQPLHQPQYQPQHHPHHQLQYHPYHHPHHQPHYEPQLQPQHGPLPQHAVPYPICQNNLLYTEQKMTRPPAQECNLTLSEDNQEDKLLAKLWPVWLNKKRAQIKELDWPKCLKERL